MDAASRTLRAEHQTHPTPSSHPSKPSTKSSTIPSLFSFPLTLLTTPPQTSAIIRSTSSPAMLLAPRLRTDIIACRRVTQVGRRSCGAGVRTYRKSEPRVVRSALIVLAGSCLGLGLGGGGAVEEEGSEGVEEVLVLVLSPVRSDMRDVRIMGYLGSSVVRRSCARLFIMLATVHPISNAVRRCRNMSISKRTRAKVPKPPSPPLPHFSSTGRRSPPNCAGGDPWSDSWTRLYGRTQDGSRRGSVRAMWIGTYESAIRCPTASKMMSSRCRI